MIWDDLRFIFMMVVLGFLFPFAMISDYRDMVEGGLAKGFRALYKLGEYEK
jgi:hypothetical protein